MSRKSREWSFEKAVKESRTALQSNGSWENVMPFFEARFSDPNATPQTLGPAFADNLAITKWCEALDSVVDHPGEAWKRIHLVCRSHVLQWRIHLERVHELASNFPDELRRGRLGIGCIGYDFLGQILMTVAFSASLGVDVPAQWLGDRCVQIAVDREPISEPGMLTTGRTEPFLFRLYSLWRGIDANLAELGVYDYGPFQAVFDCWQDPTGLEAATLKLCELHAHKAANVELEDDDLVFGLQSGPFREFPAEILFLQRVRRDLGLSVPNPEHSLLRSPLMNMPFPCPRSGFDPYIHKIYTKCKEWMPSLKIPWEEFTE